jgi:hypothetical protein
MTEIEKYYQSLMRDIAAIQESSGDEGSATQQVFTQIAVEMLADAGETENVVVAYDEKDLQRKGQHRINAYAVSENYETVDLFISIFNQVATIQTVAKSDIDRATTQISNFFHKAIDNNYVDKIEESSEIFEFADTLANYQELKENLVRVNAIIVTNGEYKGDFPQSDTISGYNVYYRIIDINYLYKISEQARVPIELDFEDFEGEQFEIPCLSANTQNSDYKAYIAIIPGTCLAKLYERYGARLLEQNVRSFLQLTGKINKGIRDTIRNEPQMFLAFNNGIAATADYIGLDETNRYIKKICNLQIVNGGQTTASIYHTWIDKKVKVDVSKIFVQVKFSVIENPDQYSEIVTRISRYANTQNKVKDEDFSANNSALVVFEKLSRYILSPITAQNNIQTSWFFERARGQYKTALNREGTTPRKNAFKRKNPQKQMFTKVELAKFVNAYQEVYDGKKLVIGPHCVVGGDTKNFNQYIYYNLPDNIKKINNVYFEDTIAKCILYKTVQNRYGIHPNSIGRERQTVVPYTLALFNIISDNKLDLYKIWKNQQISQQLSDFIYNLMKQVNKFIWDNSPSTNYNEEGKKERMWVLVKENIKLSYNLSDIKSDLIDENNLPKRNTDIDISEEELKQNREIVKSIPYALWSEIGKWGKDSGYLDITKQNVVSNIAYKLRQNKEKVIADEECKKGVEILDIVASRNEELLQKTEEYAGKLAPVIQVEISDDDKDALILQQVRKMLSFNNGKNILTDEQTDFLFDIVNEKRERDYDANAVIFKCMEKLTKKGFTV